MTTHKKRIRRAPSDQPERVRERVRRHREQKKAATPPPPTCSICGENIRRGGLSEKFGFHQKCDRARFQALYREQKET